MFTIIVCFYCCLLWFPYIMELLVLKCHEIPSGTRVIIFTRFYYIIYAWFIYLCVLNNNKICNVCVRARGNVGRTCARFYLIWKNKLSVQRLSVNMWNIIAGSVIYKDILKLQDFRNRVVCESFFFCKRN